MMFLFQLRNELWKLFGKKRTYIGFIILLIAQNAMLIAFRFSHWSRNMATVLEGNGFSATGFISNMTVAIVMLYPIAIILLPLYVTLIGGDLMAKESEDGTLRMILSRPISRIRLLLVKWVAGGIFSFVLVLTLGVTALLSASIWFHWGGLFVFLPGEAFSIFEPEAGLKHYIVAHLFLTIKAFTLMGMALMFSCFNIKPAAATILALSVLFTSFAMQMIPFMKEYENWLPSFQMSNVWFPILSSPIPWWKIGSAFSILAGFNLTFLLVGCSVFQMRDIKS
jgi:ABC-2 type transport system permease protein